MFTSCQASEGKSFVTMNVMRTLARLGKRVVLVDADLRRSVIVSKYGLQFSGQARPMGLSHLLAGKANVEDVVYETNIPGAYIVPTGREISNSLPLLVVSALQEAARPPYANGRLRAGRCPPAGRFDRRGGDRQELRWLSGGGQLQRGAPSGAGRGQAPARTDGLPHPRARFSTASSRTITSTANTTTNHIINPTMPTTTTPRPTAAPSRGKRMGLESGSERPTGCGSPGNVACGRIGRSPMSMALYLLCMWMYSAFFLSWMLKSRCRCARSGKRSKNNR